MPRKYKHTLRSRRYTDYNKEQLDLYLQAIKSGQSNRNKQADTLCRTLVYKLNKLHLRPPEPPLTITNELEDAIAVHAETMSTYGFSLKSSD